MSPSVRMRWGFFTTARISDARPSRLAKFADCTKGHLLMSESNPEASDMTPEKKSGDLSHLNGADVAAQQSTARMGTARLIRENVLRNPEGMAHLYHLSPPFDGEPYVIVSAAVVCGTPETLIFPSNADGEVIDWGELVALRGECDHDNALRLAGYEVAS